MKQGGKISLCGFMGCGKSRVGEKLRTLLCRNMIDLDRYIEDKAGMGIPEIFSSRGEAAFRQMEKECLEEVLNLPGEVILSLGGGTLMTAGAVSLVKSQSTCIYLKASPDTLYENLKNDSAARPMLQGDLRARINELLRLREAVYEEVADIIISTDGKSFDAIAEEIAERL